MTERAPRALRLLPLIALALAAPPAGAQTGADPAVLLARAADADGDGRVTAAEWRSLLDGLGADEQGAVDALRVARAVLDLDPDGDGELTRADVERGLAGGRGGGFLALMLPELADADADGNVSEAERVAFLATLDVEPGTALPEATVLAWMGRAETIPPADRNAVTAGVFLVGLRASFDLDSSGTVTLDDLRALHAQVDTNGDGALEADELAARRRSAGRRALGIGASEQAPSTRDRTRPCLIPWQRSLEDALAVQRETGKPLLICVNMDGENASEALAWGRYRDPAFAELAAGFVPLLASPDVHEERARDDSGRRLPDPRFGRLICAEHVDIEPLLFERYFSGQRVAPRHVGVAPDGTILFDVYLLQDLSVIDAKLREFGVTDAPAVDPAALTEADLLASFDAARRDELERRYAEADEGTRARFAAVALSDTRAAQQPELLRMALRDPSEKVRREAVWTIARHLERAPLELLPPAFARAAEREELRALLVGGLRREAKRPDDRARAQRADFLARAFAGLLDPARDEDRARWRRSIESSPRVVEVPPTAADFDAAAEVMDALAELAEQSPEDVGLAVQLAAARMRFARIFLETGRDPTLLFEDIVRTCQRVLEREPSNGRALGHHAWASYMLSDLETAGAMAARAIAPLTREAGSPLAAEVLMVLADVRTRAIYAAISSDTAWPAGAVAEARLANELLLIHPAGGDEARWRSYYDLLGALSGLHEQAALVRRGLARLPDSGVLHTMLREQVLRDEGARALEAAYDERPLSRARGRHGPALDWFHGLATLLAAERDVRDRDEADALDTYARCVERFQRAIDAAPGYADSALHYQCLAHAGRARLLSGSGRLEEAVEALLLAAGARPASFELADGLGSSPRDSARELRAALRRADQAELLRVLDEGLAAAGV